MIRMPRKLLARIGFPLMFPASLFGVVVIILVSDAVGISFFTDVARFFKEGILGIGILGLLGALTLVLLITQMLRWTEGERLKKLRYDMLLFLSSNRRLSGKRTPVSQIADSVSADPHDVELALNVLLIRGEIKGRMDLSRGTYAHSAVTKKGHILARMSSPSGRKSPMAQERNIRKDNRLRAR